MRKWVDAVNAFGNTNFPVGGVSGGGAIALQILTNVTGDYTSFSSTVSVLNTATGAHLGTDVTLIHCTEVGDRAADRGRGGGRGELPRSVAPHRPAGQDFPFGIDAEILFDLRQDGERLPGRRGGGRELDLERDNPRGTAVAIVDLRGRVSRRRRARRAAEQAA